MQGPVGEDGLMQEGTGDQPVCEQDGAEDVMSSCVLRTVLDTPRAWRRLRRVGRDSTR